MPALMFRFWLLNEIWIIDFSSALIGMLMSSSKLFLFSNEAHLNSGVRLLLELYCVIVNLACCLLYYLCEISNGIHNYQLTIELLHFCFRIRLGFRI